MVDVQDCGELVLAEDGSCVPASFYEQQETTPVVQLPDSLPATGMDDVSPLVGLVGVALIIAGLLARRVRTQS